MDAAIASLSNSSIAKRGAVYTRREVVDFILDLVGYTADQPLHLARVLEPSMGHGDFLLPVIDRLLRAYEREVVDRCNVVADLSNCIVAVELHRPSYEKTRTVVLRELKARGLTETQSCSLCSCWLRHGDFLLLPFESNFTHVIGNPPYVRQELIPELLMAEYRRRFSTIFDRADLYVPFIEKSLLLLAPGGCLGFICADRWIKNRYGGPLRQLVAEKFRLKCFVDMGDTNAFLSEVSAYPAIVVIDRHKPGATRIASHPTIDPKSLRALAKAMTQPRLGKTKRVTEVAHLAQGSEPWMLEASQQLSLLRRLEATYPTLEETRCKVRIGVATGADKVFIAPFEQLDVEPDRKLPIVMTRDILDGSVKWRGLGVLNPFGADGKLVSLNDYPKLATYLKTHGTTIKSRHVSKKNPHSWYRTIDRIYSDLTYVPKLLIPDIKGTPHIVYEEGKLYPHHNLYFITSNKWDLHALQAVLLSDVTRMFITLYSTKMRGGYMRFQAQYLRRLRIPHWQNVPIVLRAQLVAAGQSRELKACNEAAVALYKLTHSERQNISAFPGETNAA